MDLSIITVTYQSREHIDKCILSVVTSTFAISYEHIVVDNHSTDGTAEFIEEGYSSYVTLIKNNKNLGFAAANNQALAIAKGRYILFLNPDMQINRGTLDSFVAWMDGNPKVGAAGCKLVASIISYYENLENQIPDGCFETTHPILRPILIPTPFPFFPFFLNIKSLEKVYASHFSYPSFNDDIEQEVDHIRGSFLMVRKEILNHLGFAFDPAYFILIEDLDLNLEIKRLGYKVVYNPLISCIDYFGRSFLQQTKAWKYIQLSKSFCTYVKKWHSPLHLIWLNFVIPLGFLLRAPKWGLKASLKALKQKNGS